MNILLNLNVLISQGKEWKITSSFCILFRMWLFLFVIFVNKCTMYRYSRVYTSKAYLSGVPELKNIEQNGVNK